MAETQYVTESIPRYHLVSIFTLRMSCRIYASGGIYLNTCPKLTDSIFQTNCGWSWTLLISASPSPTWQPSCIASRHRQVFFFWKIFGPSLVLIVSELIEAWKVPDLKRYSGGDGKMFASSTNNDNFARYHHPISLPRTCFYTRKTSRIDCLRCGDLVSMFNYASDLVRTSAGRSIDNVEVGRDAQHRSTKSWL